MAPSISPGLQLILIPFIVAAYTLVLALAAYFGAVFALHERLDFWGLWGTIFAIALVCSYSRHYRNN